MAITGPAHRLYGSDLDDVKPAIQPLRRAARFANRPTIKESLHLIEFAILYVLLVLASLTFERRTFTPLWNILLAVFAGLYGVSDEIHQSFYPYRSASLFDLVKDFTGILICFYFIRGALFRGKFVRLRRILT